MIQTISALFYGELIQNAKTVGWTNAGEPKVFLNADKKVIKLCHCKSLLQRVFHSRSKKLIRISRKLAALRINTITPEAHYYCRELNKELIVYPWIEGLPLREAAESDIQILKKFAVFVAKLHHLNIYFRGAHIDNIVVQNNGELALIDMANTKFKINVRRRAKNLHYIMHTRASEIFARYDKKKFLADYLQAANLPTQEMQKLQKLFTQHLANDN